MQHFAYMQVIAKERGDERVAAAERYRLTRSLRASSDTRWNGLLASVRAAADRWRVVRANRRRLRELSRALASTHTSAARQELFAIAMASDWRLFDDVQSHADATCGAGL